MNFNVKHFVKRIPGATHTYEFFRHFYYVVALALWSRFFHLVKPRFKSKGKAPRNLLIAVTVSTNYSDLLKICLRANRGWFDKWIVVTAEADVKTREVLAAHPEVTVLLWDPNHRGAAFDKGSGVRLGQEHAYQHYPNSWYLVIDSDIVLEGNPGTLRELLPNLPARSIYGIQRWDYASMRDLRKKINESRYGEEVPGLGYFQLYSIPYFYNRSKDASVCDEQFLAIFRKSQFLPTISCSHLGQESHWRGRQEGSRDFIE